MNDKFLLSGQYRELLSKHGIDVGAALRRAHQPEDLFAHPSPSMTTAGYHDFMEAIAGQIEDDELPIAIGSSDKNRNVLASHFCSLFQSRRQRISPSPGKI